MITFGTRASGMAQRRAAPAMGVIFHKGEWMDSGEDPALSPTVALIEQPAGFEFMPHFHRQNQFQVFVGGTGSIGRHPLAPVVVHVAERSSAQWLAACERLDIPAAPYNRLADLERDPHLAPTGYFTTMADPSMGTLVTPAAPLKFNGTASQPALPPRLGQHTVEVLEQAGLSGSHIEQLLASGAIMQPTNEETS